MTVQPVYGDDVLADDDLEPQDVETRDSEQDVVLAVSAELRLLTWSLNLETNCPSVLERAQYADVLFL